MHNCQSVETGGNIVQHNPTTLGKRLELSDWSRLHDIEGTEEYKAHKKRFPCQGHGDQGHHLAGNFVYDYELGIFDSGATSNLCGGRNSNQRDDNRTGDRSQSARLQGNNVSQGGP